MIGGLTGLAAQGVHFTEERDERAPFHCAAWNWDADLLSGSVVLFSRDQATSSLLRLLGVGGLVVGLLTHIAEAVDLFSWMQ